MLKRTGGRRIYPKDIVLEMQYRLYQPSILEDYRDNLLDLQRIGMLTICILEVDQLRIYFQVDK